MALWPKESWNHLRILATTAGTFASVYVPRPREEVLVLAPDGQQHAVKTIGLADWHLAAEDGKLCLYHTRIIEHDGQRQGLDLMRVPTAIPCGVAVGALISGGTGPVGPAGAPGPRGADGAVGPPGAPGRDGKDAEVSEDHMRRIAALTAEAVLLGAPAADHYGLAENARFGTRVQETIAVMFTNQAFLQEFVKALDEAALGLMSGGYAPKVQGG